MVRCATSRFAPEAHAPATRIIVISENCHAFRNIGLSRFAYRRPGVRRGGVAENGEYRTAPSRGQHSAAGRVVAAAINQAQTDPWSSRARAPAARTAASSPSTSASPVA